MPIARLFALCILAICLAALIGAANGPRPEHDAVASERGGEAVKAQFAIIL
jgi:hypothetical protein